MGTLPDDIRRLLYDCELFVAEILLDENLSPHAKETQEVLLNNFNVVRRRNPQVFPPRRPESRHGDSSDDQASSVGRSDDASVISDYQEEGSSEFLGDIPSVAAQDLSNILKQGYLEKKKRDHSFFSSEWQKKWCVLNNTIFYYFSSDKDKQQRGSFFINGYSVELVSNLRKDSKKNACFELSAPGRRTYQFTASSQREAKEWVDQIMFTIKDLSSHSIPVDEEDEEEFEYEGSGEGDEETYDDIEGIPAPLRADEWRSRQGVHEPGEGQEEQGAADEEDIYELLPDEDFTDSTDESSEKHNKPDYANYYQGVWDCEADEQDELTFQRGDLIYVISKEYNIHGWWVGQLNGSVGIVPKDFLQPAYIL